MSTKSILLAVAEPQALAAIAQALGDGWESTSVSNEADALAQLEQRAFDALLVDFNLGSPDASQLLNQAFEKRPETTRFLLAYEADLVLVAAYVSGPHEILPKPVEPVSLKSRINRGVTPQDSKLNQSACDPAKGPGVAMAVPAVYDDVLKALDLPCVTKRQVGEIIAGDAALTYEVLRLTQSTYLGSPRCITDPVEAVELLGLETVKALVMALRFLAGHSQLKPGYLSIEKIWQHSTNVAQLARDLILFETKDQALAAEALVAGLLHDLGKVVLASNFDDLYGRVHSLARNQTVALWDIEKEMFGASHGEIGACLVGMWDMPNSIVQAVALHHEPPVGEDQHLTPLAAVHIADVLEHEAQPGNEFRVTAAINTAFLDEIGLLRRLPVWRAVFSNRLRVSASPEVEPLEKSRPQILTPVLSSMPPPSTANQLPAPAAATKTATLGQPEKGDGMSAATVSHQLRWVFAGAAVAVLCVVTLWLGTRPPTVRARTTEATPSQAQEVVSPVPSPEPPSTVVSASAVPEETPTPELILAPDPGPAVPEPEPPVATAPQLTATNAPSPTLTTEETAPPELRLNGIIFKATQPAAIVNGKMVYVGDWVSGAVVVAINRTSVTLEINGRQISVFLN